MAKSLIPPFGKSVNLSDYDTRNGTSLNRETGTAELEALQTELDELQDLFRADGRFGFLVILQAIDAGGKDGTIRTVFHRVDPLGLRAVGFKAPSEDELAHDFLWRIHAMTPARGETVIFNRSHYEDVLIARVKNLVPKERWSKRYAQINAFEEMLVDEGTIILKFFLHVSREEQRERLQERVDDPRKRWKFRSGDLEDRALWNDYQKAFEAMLERCNTPHAPWHIVPADQNWFRNLTVARTIVEKLKSLELRYPEPEQGIKDVKVV